MPYYLQTGNVGEYFTLPSYPSTTSDSDFYFKYEDELNLTVSGTLNFTIINSTVNQFRNSIVLELSSGNNTWALNVKASDIAIDFDSGLTLDSIVNAGLKVIELERVNGVTTLSLDGNPLATDDTAIAFDRTFNRFYPVRDSKTYSFTFNYLSDDRTYSPSDSKGVGELVDIGGQSKNGTPVNFVDFDASLIEYQSEKPVIELAPPQTSYTITVGDTFTYPVATAKDNVDPDEAVPRSGNVYENTVGVYTLTYDHTDTDGNAADTVTVTVNVVEESSNTPPSVDAGTGGAATGGSTVTLSPTVSDADSDPLTFTWSQVSGSAGTFSDVSIEAPDFTFANADGDVVLQLSVNDGTDTVSDTVTFNVTESAITPILAEIKGRSRVVSGSTYKFYVKASGGNGSSLAYTWSVDNGTLGTNGQDFVELTTDSNTSYSLSVEVTDGESTVTETVNVTAVSSVNDFPLISINTLEYEGGFLAPQGNFTIQGEATSTSMNYSIGNIAYNHVKNTFYATGHNVQGDCIIELGMPELSKDTDYTQWNRADNIVQSFVRPQNTRWDDGLAEPSRFEIYGLHYNDESNRLMVQYTDSYRNLPPAANVAIFEDADDLQNCDISGWYSMTDSNGALPDYGVGSVSAVPPEYADIFGYEYIANGTRDQAIISRLSVGPSAAFLNYPAPAGAGATLPVENNLWYDLTNPLFNEETQTAESWNDDNSDFTNDIWVDGEVACALIVPETRTYMVIGNDKFRRSSAYYKGVDYAADNVSVSNGPQAYHGADWFCEYWLYSVDDLLRVKNGEITPYSVRPYERGMLNLPVLTGGENENEIHFTGGNYDPVNNRILLSVNYGDRVSTGRRPLYLSYKIDVDGVTPASNPRPAIYGRSEGETGFENYYIAKTANENIYATHVYTWRIVSGDASLQVIENDYVRVIGNTDGTVVIGVTSNDGTTESSEVTHSIEFTQNSLPAPYAGSSQSVAQGAQIVIGSDATISDVDSNAPKSTNWEQVRGTSVTVPAYRNNDVTTSTVSAPNTDEKLTFVLLQTDRHITVASKVDFTVGSPSSAPPYIIANSPLYQIIVEGDEKPDFSVKAFKDDGTEITGSIVQTGDIDTSLVSQLQTVSFDVSDENGNATTVTRTVMVRPLNASAPAQLPVVDAGQNITAVKGDTVNLSGVTVSNYDSLLWDCTSGQAPTFSDSTILNPTVTFNEVGVHTLRLTAINSDGSANDTMTATVNSSSNSAPTANAGADQSVAAGVRVQLNATLSTDPEDGVISQFGWEQVDNGADAVVLEFANTATPEFTAPSSLTAQTLEFRVQAQDSEGATSTDTVLVEVAALQENEILSTMETLDFELVTQGSLVAYKGRSNREVMQLKPSSVAGIVTAGGYLDLTQNGIAKVEVIADGKKISNENSDSIKIDGSKILARLGDLDIPTGGRDSIQPTFMIVLYVGSDTRGLVVASNATSGYKPLSYRVEDAA